MDGLGERVSLRKRRRSEERVSRFAVRFVVHLAAFTAYTTCLAPSGLRFHPSFNSDSLHQPAFFFRATLFSFTLHLPSSDWGHFSLRTEAQIREGGGTFWGFRRR
jgi:hypothetical protein